MQPLPDTTLLELALTALALPILPIGLTLPPLALGLGLIGLFAL